MNNKWKVSREYMWGSEERWSATDCHCTEVDNCKCTFELFPTWQEAMDFANNEIRLVFEIISYEFEHGRYVR